MILTPAVGVKVTQTAGVGAAQTISRDTRPGLWGRSKAGDTQGLEVGESPAMRNSAHQGHCGCVCVSGCAHALAGDGLSTAMASRLGFFLFFLFSSLTELLWHISGCVTGQG